MWESRRDFQRVWEGWESGFYGFPCFPHAVISMACLSNGPSTMKLLKSPLQQVRVSSGKTQEQRCRPKNAHFIRLCVHNCSVIGLFTRIPCRVISSCSPPFQMLEDSG